MKLRDRLLEDETNPQEQDELPFLILGRNAVKEAIKSERSIDRIEVVGDPDGSLREILGLARERKLVIREVDKRHLVLGLRTVRRPTTLATMAAALFSVREVAISSSL
jgi:tRNA G18 (ribose-2'-O)-methylase SpoU